MTWLDVRATSGSREALVRCAVTLLGELATVRVASIGGAFTCRVDARGEGIDRAIAEVRSALSGRVEIVPAVGEERPDRAVAGDAWDPNEWLAGSPIEAIDHTADEAFAVTARDRADLLAAAAEALGGLIVRPGRVRALVAREVRVAAPDSAWADDDRLFAWLAEVLFTLDAGRFALRRAVVLDDDERGVRGMIFGEPIDESRHEVRGGIKAVTYHGLEIEAIGGGLRATVVVDV